MRISDWSSDVCSSDLPRVAIVIRRRGGGIWFSRFPSPPVGREIRRGFLLDCRNMSAAAADTREGVRGMQEIVKGVFTWSWFSEPHGYNFNGHLVRHAGGNICIAPVEPADAVLPRCSRHGVARLLLTNPTPRPRATK